MVWQWIKPVEYARFIGDPRSAVTVDDMVKARASRAVEVAAYYRERAAEGTIPIVGSARAAIAEYIEHGGQRPWEEPPEPGASYPPIKETTQE